MESKDKLITEIVEKEYSMLDKVRNCDGRAECQDNKREFFKAREAQFYPWNVETLKSYLLDLRTAESQGRNLMVEKYAYMMESLWKKEYRKISQFLPKVSNQKQRLVAKIVRRLVGQTENAVKENPGLVLKMRPVHSAEDLPYSISVETYFKCEFQTYSQNTLEKLDECIVEQPINDDSFVDQIFSYTAHVHGYRNIQEAVANSK